MTYKGKVLFQWALIFTMSFQIFYTAYDILFGGLNCYFLSKGLSIEIIFTLGVIELVTAFAIFFKSVRFWFAFGQMFILLGIAISHLEGSEALAVLWDISSLGFLAIILWFEKESYYLSEETVSNRP